jgi:hypothetical protein
MALMGIVNACALVLNDDFNLGLWKSQLIENLLWSVVAWLVRLEDCKKS